MTSKKFPNFSPTFSNILPFWLLRSVGTPHFWFFQLFPQVRSGLSKNLCRLAEAGPFLPMRCWCLEKVVLGCLKTNIIGWTALVTPGDQRCKSTDSITEAPAVNRMAYSRVHTSSGATDPAKLLLFNKVKETQCCGLRFGPTYGVE